MGVVFFLILAGFFVALFQLARIGIECVRKKQWRFKGYVYILLSFSIGVVLIVRIIQTIVEELILG